MTMLPIKLELSLLVLDHYLLDNQAVLAQLDALHASGNWPEGYPALETAKIQCVELLTDMSHSLCRDQPPLDPAGTVNGMVPEELLLVIASFDDPNMYFMNQNRVFYGLEPAFIKFEIKG